MYRILRPAPDAELLREVAALVRAAKCPLIVAGGGVIYAEAANALRNLAAATGIAWAESMAGNDALRFADPSALGSRGATATPLHPIAPRDAAPRLRPGPR